MLFAQVFIYFSSFLHQTYSARLCALKFDARICASFLYKFFLRMCQSVKRLYLRALLPLLRFAVDLFYSLNLHILCATCCSTTFCLLYNKSIVQLVVQQIYNKSK